MFDVVCLSYHIFISFIIFGYDLPPWHFLHCSPKKKKNSLPLLLLLELICAYLPLFKGVFLGAPGAFLPLYEAILF